MEDDAKELKECVWDLTNAIAELFRKALHDRNGEAAKYFGHELQRVGKWFFAQSDAEKKIETNLLDQSAQAMATDESRKAMKQEECSVKGRKVRSHLPIGEIEAKVLSLVLISGDPPADLEHLAGLVYPEHTASTDLTIRMGARGRCSKAIKNGLLKVRRILRGGAINDLESDFLKRLQDKMPQSTSADLEEYLDQQIAAKYLKIKTDEMCVKCGKHPIRIKKRGLCRFCVSQFYENRRNNIAPESVDKIKSDLKSLSSPQSEQDGSKDWIKLLYAAFFHPDGPSLDEKIVSKRTMVSLNMVAAALGGALDTLRDYWDKGDQSADKEAVMFIQMIKEQWPNQSLDNVLENVKLDGAEDSSTQIFA